MRKLMRVLLVGMLVTVAGCPLDHEYGYALMNRRDHPLDVQVRVALACGDDVDLEDPASYGRRRSLTLDPQSFMSFATLMSHQPYTASGEVPSCKAIWLRVAGEHELVLVWEREPSWTDLSDPTPYSVIVEGPAQHVVMHMPKGIDELPAPFP